ncbi:MAG: Gfo/Idh/MocA family oxidoreductase [Candidatus Pristimantibacillus lignocellulolyticus]|uniref:Gfo/Idh/MocA family oxidoreductase n=1 Tax=Candidatus Pristimantibacillus lignocellulolyticus TaxID=2994561 RepID=A0A9J6ZF95_9BACL|nr:MAG: Gfo/Idh/MocA family oxidoreductase [Candidatus Pristimantibacillus lignocellulolyticus]
MSKVKVAVIGCGSISKYRHIPEYASNANVELVAFVDPIIERAELYANEHGAQAFTDYKEMLAAVKPDAVSVCTPNFLHAEMTIEAAKAGAHVLVEKPMAVTDAEAAAMIEATTANNVKLMVGHNQRFVPAHEKAKEILKSGILGKVLTFRTSFGHPGPDSWSIDGADSWFFRKEEAIMGAMGDLGVHKSDLIRWMLDDEVSEIAAFVGTLDKKDTESDDNSSCILRMKSGAIGTLVASWTYYKGEDNSTVLWCENGVMRVCTDPIDDVIVELRDGTITKYQTGEMSTNEKQVASGVIEKFIESIVNDTVPAVTGEEGRASLKVILDAFESQATGRIIKVN